MSGGAYRDDHDAALARVEALEQELETARADHERVLALERELAKVKAERDRLKDAGPSPPPGSPVPAVPTPEPLDARGKLVARMVVLSMLVMVAIAGLVVHKSKREAQQRVDHAEAVSRYRTVVECIERAAATSPDDPDILAQVMATDHDPCAIAFEAAIASPRIRDDVREQLQALASSIGRVVVARAQLRAGDWSEQSPELRQELETALGHERDHAIALQNMIPSLQPLEDE